ncbi:flagellar hook-associated protein FlgK [Hydrogenophaga sp.]|uniref:flagellar hook-associated protein FlgK n=1 Tax=Hydrogenophaga sp. TaxID=1904254 RepID=UPI00286DC724|nr:flagellar hook-associated protein FlgK [Hydrogenophaga sp.]
MTAALNIGARALNANLAALQVIGHNIANVNTEGYSRQSVEMMSSGYQVLGGNYFGKGAEIDTVSRAHSAYLTREAQLAGSLAAADGERYTRLQQLETLFPTGEDGLGVALNDMLNAWSDIASSPTDLSARVVALAEGEQMAARLRDTAGQLDSLAHSGGEQARSTVITINRLAQDIAKANQRIIENQGSAGAPNDLLDQRDALVAELSQHIQLSTIPADDGSLSVFVAGSQPLVLGQRANSLAVTRDVADSAQIHISFLQGSVKTELADATLGGQLGGLMTFMSEDLTDMQNLLGRMALALGTTVNAQNRLGVDLAGNPGGDFFLPAANTTGLPASTNTGSAELHASVSDPTALQASDYEVRFDAGGVSVVRLSDGNATSFAGLPAEVDGLRFELDAGAGSAGDRFRVKPFADAARNMQVAIGSPTRLAAASPVQVTPGATNAGGLSIEGLHAVQASANLTDPVTLTFQADGTVTATATDTGLDLGSVTYTAGQPLMFNGWSLTLRGSPAAGDTLAIAASTTGSTQQNAGNAKAMLGLRDLATFDGVALADGYGSLLSHLGTSVQGAKFESSFSSQVASSTEDARAAVSGVNLDEEAARLLQFQQSYQAAAKFLQVAQSTFDTLLQTLS